MKGFFFLSLCKKCSDRDDEVNLKKRVFYFILFFLQSFLSLGRVFIILRFYGKKKTILTSLTHIFIFKRLQIL